MKIEKTTGIVLSARNTGEADIMTSVLTDTRGKKTFIFKGLKKSRRRPLTAAEPGNIVSLVYYSNSEKEVSVVKEQSVEKYNTALKKDLGKLMNMLFMLEVADKTIPPGDDACRLYRLLTAALGRCEQTENNAKLTAFYLIHIIKLHGILPAPCPAGAGKINYSFKAGISDEEYSAGICINGHKGLSDIQTDFVTNSLSSKWDVIEAGNYVQSEIEGLILILTGYLEKYFHVSIKSGPFRLE